MTTMRQALPLRLTSFVGRERETAEVAALVGARRLVTLVGAPGVGKTRLSLRVADGLLDTFPDGVWLAELAPLADPALVPQAIATVLSVREQPGCPLIDTLADTLRSHCLLLLLDNCEHLISAVAVLAEALLRVCPELRILATSREPLASEGEVVWRVPSLSLPATDVPASPEAPESVRLFVERAQEADPSFALTEQSASAVAQICRRLDGIPLAIELAAARVRALSEEQIAARLDDRFRLLTGGRRTALPRQQTLRGAVDWSYDLLSGPEQTLLRRLAVFAGGFTLEAAEAAGTWAPGADVSAPAPVALTPEPISSATLVSLVDKSLVQVGEAPDGERRYHLLETLRQYGLEKLTERGELAAARDRHRDYFLAVVEEVEPRLVGRDQVPAMRQLERELDNLRAALAWCLETATDRGESPLEASDRVAVSPRSTNAGVCLAGALWRFWWRYDRLEEGRRWLTEALARTAPDTSSDGTFVLARARFGVAQLACYQGDFRVGVEHMEEALTLWQQLGDESNVVMALQRLAFYRVHLGDFERAERLCEESVARGRRHGDPFTLANALLPAGVVLEVLGQFERSRAFCEESLAIYRQLEHIGGMMAALGSLARAVGCLGDLAQATVLLEESLALAGQLGDRRFTAEDWKDLGRTALLGGDAERAIEMHRLALPVYRELHDYLGTSLCLLDLGGARTLQAMRQLPPARSPGKPTGEPDTGASLEAARLYAAAGALRERNGIVLHPHRRAPYERDLAILCEHLGHAAFEQAWAEGAAMSLEQAADYALAVTEPPEVPPAEPPPAQTVLPEREKLVLSQRERDVAVLIARGLTNRQIGDELTLSERTVDTHVRNILSKLDLTSRAQIAAWTVERGLGTSARQ